MIIVHAAPVEDVLHLWCEAPPGGEEPLVPEPGRGLRGVPLHPYDAGLEGAADALSAAGIDLTSVFSEPVLLAAWLPSAGGRPCPSSPLVAERPRGRLALKPWAVTGIPLDPDLTIALLSACSGAPVLAPGISVGPDLTFWAAALKLAGALVARERFLPDVHEEGDGWSARWSLVLPADETERLMGWVRQMPPAARALSLDGRSPPDIPSARCLTGFLGGIVDHVVRTCAGQHPGASRAPHGPASLHDRWLHALLSPDARLDGTAQELKRFAAEVAAWRRSLDRAAQSPFRLCFRLDEPEGEAAPWRVRYLLQPVADPSLLVPAEEVWRGSREVTRALGAEAGDLREHLLAQLGQASGLAGRIEASLREPAPSGYDLDATGAYEFLTVTGAALAQAGFRVLLPAWWGRRGAGARLALRARVRSPELGGGSGLSLSDLVQFRWEAALGGEPLSLEELQALARLKAPLVRLRGRWVQVNPEDLRAAMDLLEDGAVHEVPAAEIVRMALGGGPAPGGLEIEDVSAQGWVGEVLDRLRSREAVEELPPPGGLRGRLRPYQVRGYSWLAFLRRWGLGACLADDMGLGKTVQALALVLRDWEQAGPRGRRPVLLVCPTSVVGNWQKEAARFTPDLPVLVHHGSSRDRGDAFRRKARRHALVISTYALLHRDIQTLRGVPWAGVILDEAQNIKNPDTKQARAARSLEAEYRIALTGTPVENNVGDLWSLMEFLNPGLLGSRAGFRQRFFVPIQLGRDPGAAEQLKRLTGPFILRRVKTDRAIISDLPEKLEMKVYCTLTREQASLYAAVVDEATRAIAGAEGIQRRGLVLSTLLRLKQVCNHPAQLLGDGSSVPGRSGKLARLTEMLEEVLAEGDRALVFTQFAEMGHMLRRHLQETFGREVPFLHGGVRKKERDRMIERFQSGDGGPPVFVLSLKAGGTGLNLTAANHVFHFDRWWNPAVEDQATDRVFRIGQTRNVQIHKFVCMGTVEEKIDEMIERKKETAQAVVGTGEDWITELSTEELRELFALRAEALGAEP